MKKSPSLFTLLTSAFILVSCLISCSGAPVTHPSASPETPKPASTPTVMPCTVLHVPVTPEALGAEFGDRGHMAGPAGAPVTIVVFSDYQCPACAYLAASLKKIRTDHPTDMRLVYINTPLAERDKDALAVQAAEAADLQGKFWEMNDLLFEKQAEWSALAPGEFAAWATQRAAGLGMDAARFQADFQGEVVAGRLQQAVQASGSPSILPPVLFVNSTSPYSGLADFASLDAVVRMEALTARQFSACPPWGIDPLRQYVATLHTAKGDAVVQLYPDKASLAVNNFVFLARQGWYDGVTFYRVLPNLLAATGDPSETGMGNPGYLFETEIPAGLRFDQPGMLAMDNSGPNTNGSRFFVTLASHAELNGQYTIFGRVLSGLEVFSALAPRDPQPGVFLPPGDELINVTIEER
jgi:cyclophilin family peptidyl-prolyl cis-trans isomerase/protein-disulfide isomerase